MNKFSRQARQSVVVTISKPIFDCDILSVDKAGLHQSFCECRDLGRDFRRPGMKKTDMNCGLLRARHKRPRCRRTAEKSDELAPSHCLPRGSGQRIVSTLTCIQEEASACPLWVRSRHLQCINPCP